jgi:hypothetical protein
MGRAQRNPSFYPRVEMMGFAALYPFYDAHRDGNQVLPIRHVGQHSKNLSIPARKNNSVYQ